MSDTMTLFSTTHGYSDLAGGGEPLSPLDGRYRAVAAPLANYLSEAGLNRARVHVEIEWLIFLLDNSVLPGAPKLTDAERVELGELTATAMRVSREVAGPHGFNLGMNQGEVAGAGIAAHLHQHVVPRWAGDANFLPIIARTKAVPELLEDARARLAAAWPKEG